MKTFNLSIVSDTKTVYSGPSDYCGVTTMSGSIGFEARHEDFMGILSPGSEVEYRDKDGSRYKLSVKDGLLSFKDNNCILIVGL